MAAMVYGINQPATFSFQHWVLLHDRPLTVHFGELGTPFASAASFLSLLKIMIALEEWSTGRSPRSTVSFWSQKPSTLALKTFSSDSGLQEARPACMTAFSTKFIWLLLTTTWTLWHRLSYVFGDTIKTYKPELEITTDSEDGDSEDDEI